MNLLNKVAAMVVLLTVTLPFTLFLAVYFLGGLWAIGLFIPAMFILIPMLVASVYAKGHENDVDDSEPYDMKHPDLWP